MKVGEAMTLEVQYARPEDTVQRAAGLLRDLGVGLIPVVSDGAVVGVVTERDLAVRFVAEGLDFSGTTAADIMSRDVLTVYEDQEAAEASELLENGRADVLVVLDRKNKLVGVVTPGDLAREAPAVEESMSDQPGADVVNDLIKDELSAVQTYHQAAEKIHGPALAEVRRLENEHEKAAALLQQAVAERGIEPATKAGVWGLWSKLVEGAAAAVGESTALRALKEGEERGVRDYEDALRDESLPSDVRALIQTNLLPQTREHIPALERYLGGRGPSGTSYHADQGYGDAGGGRGVA